MDRLKYGRLLEGLWPRRKEVMESKLSQLEADDAIERLCKSTMLGARRLDELTFASLVCAEICSACDVPEYRRPAGIYYGLAASFQGQIAATAALHAASVMYLKYAQEFETWLAAGLAEMAKTLDNQQAQATHAEHLWSSSISKRGDYYSKSRELTFEERRLNGRPALASRFSLGGLSLPPLPQLTMAELEGLHAHFDDAGLPYNLTKEERERLAVYVCWGQFCFAGHEAGIGAALEHAERLSLEPALIRELRAAFELMDRSEPPAVEDEDEPLPSEGDDEEGILDRPVEDLCLPPDRPVRPRAWVGPPQRLRFEYTYRIEPQYSLEWDAQSGLLAFSSSVHGVASAQLIVDSLKWDEFWKLIRQARPWEWEASDEMPFEDGYQWTLELTQGAMSLSTQGSNSNPGDETARAPFSQLLKAMEALSRYPVPMARVRDDH